MVDFEDGLVDSDLLFFSNFSNSVYVVIVQRRPSGYLFAVPTLPPQTQTGILKLRIKRRLDIGDAFCIGGSRNKVTSKTRGLRASGLSLIWC